MEEFGHRAPPEAMRRAARAIRELTERLEAVERARREPIAIVGMACRFPGGANDPDSFWRLLAEGRDGVTDVPPDRWDADALYDPDPDAPGKMYTKRGGFLDGPVGQFDARFFDISPREAMSMDPQQRLLLELVWEALEDAGIPPSRLSGTRTGVYVGISTSDYAGLETGRAQDRIDAHSGTGNSFSVAAGRISHRLGLHGPSFPVDTACSSSLVALSLAVQGLRSEQCDGAIVGGVNLILHPATTIAMCKIRALSPQGRCSTFDAAADGYVRSEGGGLVVLKRLSDAMESGDRIHAVIRGTAVNHDGRSSGLTVPNPAAQQAVIRAALQDAGVEPKDVGLVEAHGTGTALGDPIEIRALDSVFGGSRGRSRPLPVGAVKSNLGHLEAAAGMAGLLKLVLALSREEIPPNLHLERPTPHLEWDRLPIEVPTDRIPWPRGERSRIGGVSSFGFSGTNAHVLVEEAPRMEDPEQEGPGRPVHVLPLSARSEVALGELVDAFHGHLAKTSDHVSDICFTAAVGRDHFDHRLLVTGRSGDELRAALDRVRSAGSGGRIGAATARSGKPSVAFLFPDLDAWSPGMGRALYETHPTFRALMDESDELARSALGRPVLPLLLSGDASPAERLDGDGLTGAALFAVEHGLATLWREWGVDPSLVVGLGVGEVAAACIAGMLRTEDGLRLAAARARLRAERARSGSDPDPGTLEALSASMRWNEPGIRVISPRTGRTMGEEEFRRELSLGRRSTEGVDPAPVIEALTERGVTALLEIGPAAIWGDGPSGPPPTQGMLHLPSLREPGDAWDALADSLGRLYEMGAPVDWEGFERPYPRRRVRIPTYPFQRKRYWLTSEAGSPERAASPGREVSPATDRPHPEGPEGEPRHAADGSGGRSPSLTRQHLEGATEAERGKLLLAHLRKRAAGILKLKVDEIEAERDLIELGFDSIMVTELASTLESELGLTVAPGDVLAQPSLEALATHLAGKAGSAPPTPHQAPARWRAQAFPLSYGQERIFFLDRLDPGTTILTLPVALRLVGPLNPGTLEEALGSVLERHEILRATIEVEEGRPLQRIRKFDPPALPVEDLGDLPRGERLEAALERVRELRRTPFDLALDMKLRARLLRLDEREHVLALAVHHVAADATSLGVLLDELGRSYEALAAGRPVALPPLPLQYVEHAVAERKRIEEGALGDQLDYWRRQLSDLSPLELPADRPRPSIRTHRAGARSGSVRPELRERLEKIGQEEGATLFMTLLAAFKVLLGRHAGTEGVAVGTPIAGRHRPGTERLIGMLINNLVLRTDLGGDPSFRELLTRVRQVALDAYRNQDVPFEKLLEELRPRRDPSRTPLFQVLFNFLPSLEDMALRFGDLAAEVESMGDEEANFDLTLYVERRDGLRFHAIYNADLYDADTVTELLEQYIALLESVAEDPDCRLSTFPLAHGSTSSREPIQITEGTRRTEGISGIHGSIADHFARQVHLRPDALAVETDRHRLTYRELDDYSRRIAEELLGRSGPGEGRVGLRLSGGVPMLASILAALKAGKAYVPLEFHLPEERVLSLIADAELSAVISDGVGGVLEEDVVGVPVLALPPVAASPSEDGTGVKVPPEAPAYLLYTSGSTGEPKGVVQSHANVLRHVKAYVDRLGIGPGDRLTLLSGYGFDAAVVDIFAALLSGATLCPLDMRSHPVGSLAGEIRERGITVYHSTPTVFRHLVEALGEEEQLSGVRAVVLGGEAVVSGDLERFRRHFGSRCIFVNGYGSTECTFSLLNVVSPGQAPGPEKKGEVPVGFPVEGLDVRVVNEAGEPVGTYATGEILVTGPHVALGYWNRPDLTGKTFEPDPGRPGWRTYRTGDLGRLLPDGRIEFVGRRDRQIKVRGFRIEPAEVEAALVRHDMVAAAGVAAVPRSREGPTGSEPDQLVAFVVPALPSVGLEPSTLRDHLATMLPLYMIPERFVTVDSIPRTPNGKVDRRGLLGLDSRPSPDGRETEPPGTPTETLIAGIWVELLEVEEVGRDDNFYDLGGHSLLAIQVVSRIEEATGVRIGPRDLGFQTLRQLAAACDDQARSGENGPSSFLRRVMRQLNPAAT